MPTRWKLVTPRAPGSSAAIAVLHLAGDIDDALRQLGIAPLEVGAVSLRRFSTIDRGIAARPSADTLLLMPHAGPAILAQLRTWLDDAGLQPNTLDDPRTLYPEAQSLLEARMLHTLSRAASPLAIDLLLNQPQRWAQQPNADTDPPTLARSALLNRLIDPPTVVALGPPNIGKSTLLNTLAGRAVSIVADEPGTTRDHVGVTLDLAGLVVHYIDTPGIDPPPHSHGAHDDIQREAQQLALAAAASADLVLRCTDAGVQPLRRDLVTTPSLTIALRSDLGAPGEPCDIAVSARTGEGIEQLVDHIRETLVPESALTHPGPWKFW